MNDNDHSDISAWTTRRRAGLAAVLGVAVGLAALLVPVTAGVAVESQSPPETTTTTACDETMKPTGGTVSSGGQIHHVYANECGDIEWRIYPELPGDCATEDYTWQYKGETTMNGRRYSIYSMGCNGKFNSRFEPIP